MELRSTEQELEEIRQLYAELRRCDHRLALCLEPIEKVDLSTTTTTTTVAADPNAVAAENETTISTTHANSSAGTVSSSHQQQEQQASESTTTTTKMIGGQDNEDDNMAVDPSSFDTISAIELLQRCETLRNRLFVVEVENATDDCGNKNDSTTTTPTAAAALDLQTRLDKFKKRLNEKDPITNQPRYGAKTATRVTAVLLLYETLQRNVQNLMAIPSSSSSQQHQQQETQTVTTTTTVLNAIRQEAQAERDQEELRQQAQQQLKEMEARKQQEEEQQRLELERQQKEAERQRQEAERRAQHEAILAAQRARQSAEEAARRADSEWQDSIPKRGTPEGVEYQLKCLLQSSAEDSPAAQQGALKALHTIFSQIVSRPEEPNFRRIRRDHPQFNQDIGRHAGGKEFLIAAGFRLGAIDDVPSFISTEPDLEKDMDGWAAWFDLNKATLTLLQNQMSGGSK